MKPLNIFILIMIVFIFVSSSSAELYTWVDENGVRRYTDVEVPGAERIDDLNDIPVAGEGISIGGIPVKKTAAVAGVLLLNGTIAAVIFFIRRRFSVVLNISKSTLIKIPYRIRSTRRSLTAVIKGYLKGITEVLTRAFILVISVAIVYGAALYLCKILWFSYIETPVGRRYVMLSGRQAADISNLLGGNMLTDAVQGTVLAFVICLACAVVFQFFHLLRYLYLPRGGAGRLILFGCPLNAAVAYLAKPELYADQWLLAYAATLPPALCVLGSAFETAQRLVPEASALIGRKQLHRSTINDLIYLRPLNHADQSRLLEFDSLTGRLTGNRINRTDDDLSAGIYEKIGSHDILFYRCRNERIFRCDQYEIRLQDGMRLLIEDPGKWKRCFKIENDGSIIFEIQYPRRRLTGRNRRRKNEKKDFFLEMRAQATA